MNRARFVEYLVTAVIGAVSAIITAFVILDGYGRLSLDNFVTIAGWLVAAIVTIVGWRISQRAQERLFRHQIKNAARNDIVAAVRKYQDALRDWSTDVFLLATHFKLGDVRTWTDADWQQRLGNFEAKRQRVDEMSLTSTLEQFELLFPATKSGRQDLAMFSGRLRARLSDLYVGLFAPGGRNQACTDAESIYNQMVQEMLLLEDLLVFVQNEALGEVVGRHVPFLRPKQFTQTPRFELRAEGLILTDGSGAVLFPQETQ